MLDAARTEALRILEAVVTRSDADRGGPLVRVVGSVEINRPADQVWAYVADYGHDSSWRAGVRQMRPSRPRPAQVGVTTHEVLRLLGLSFRTDAWTSPREVDTGVMRPWSVVAG